jgi:hypothetical protein
MEEPRLPGMPDWFDLDKPPPGSKVELALSPQPPLDGWIELAGEHVSSGQTFLVRAMARSEHERVLREYERSLYLVLEVVPDIPELADRLAPDLEPHAGEEGYASFEEEIERATREYPDGALIILQTELASAASSVYLAAKWCSLRAGDNEAWKGPRLVKMQVRMGTAELRGVKGGPVRVKAVGETGWEVGAGHCWVHAVTLCQYKLSAAWTPA